MTWFVVAVLGITALTMVWTARSRAVFRHGGQVYRRRPDGSFVDSLGAPVVGAALLGTLALAYQESRRGFGSSSSSDGGPVADGGWSSDGDGGSCDGGGGDGGGGGD